MKGAAACVIIGLYLLASIGWAMNLYKLTQCDYEPSYKAEILHIVGIFPIVGMFTGWIDVGK